MTLYMILCMNLAETHPGHTAESRNCRVLIGIDAGFYNLRGRGHAMVQGKDAKVTALTVGWTWKLCRDVSRFVARCLL
jgi:hypothetical protein